MFSMFYHLQPKTLTLSSCDQTLVAGDDSSVEVVLLPELGGVSLNCHKGGSKHPS